MKYKITKSSPSTVRELNLAERDVRFLTSITVKRLAALWKRLKERSTTLMVGVVSHEEYYAHQNSVSSYPSRGMAWLPELLDCHGPRATISGLSFGTCRSRELQG